MQGNLYLDFDQWEGKVNFLKEISSHKSSSSMSPASTQKITWPQPIVTSRFVEIFEEYCLLYQILPVAYAQSVNNLTLFNCYVQPLT
jgi:hypothetical protein